MISKIDTFIKIIQKNGYSLLELGFSEGASKEEIDNIEKITGQIIPDDLRQFLSKINGQFNENFYFLPDQVKLLSCQEIIEEWTQEKDYADDTADFYNEFQFEDKVRCTIYHQTRIPIAMQEGFGIFYIDYDPGPNGTTGQIIYLVNEYDFVVLADSFGEFIQKYIENMQNGILKFENEKEGFPNKYRLKSDAVNMDGYAFLEIF